MEEIVFLLLTILIELPVALLCTPRARWGQVGWVVLCVNMVTHPIGWALVSAGTPWLSVEGAIFLFEGAVFAILFADFRTRAFWAGIFMNFVSASVGVIFF